VTVSCFSGGVDGDDDDDGDAGEEGFFDVDELRLRVVVGREADCHRHESDDVGVDVDIIREISMKPRHGILVRDTFIPLATPNRCIIIQ
jgi:hypothetical protein